MILRKSTLLIGAALPLVLLSSQAHAHWCDDMWVSSYNIVVKPDSDTSPKNLFVQNNMGYQLINFKLTATGTGGAITLTAPTLKVSGTLLPGEKGTWKIASGSPAKIEDVTFSVSFGNSGQSGRYPTSGAKAVMIVRAADGSLYPSPPTGLTSTSGDQARSLQYAASADFEDVNAGLDKLLNLYCAGRGSFGSTDGVSMSNCKDASSTTCPTTKPASGTGSKYDYTHLWAAGELAIRKESLGARAAVLRARLQCGVNDGDVGFAGYALFILGYLGDDAAAKTFIQGKVTAGGDLGTIGSAALYLMGDTTQKAAVQAGAKASSVFAQAACAAALGIVDKDDATVTSVLIPLVKWIEPDTADDGKAMFAAHILELVAFDRRGWVAKGVGTGTVSFYGETGGTSTGGTGGGTGGAPGTGGASGSGGASGNKDGSVGNDAKPPAGGASGSGGVSGSGGASAGGAAGSGGKAGSGGTMGPGGATSAGGTTSVGSSTGAGGNTGVGGTASTGSNKGSGGSSTASSNSSDTGGASGNGGGTGSGSTTPSTDTTGCACNLGGHAQAKPSMVVLFMAGLAWIVGRRRRR
ncbi:MAG TPA: hypothetical protein VF550_17115 [Polyangia bacterium]